jgi:hypothetical protein
MSITFQKVEADSSKQLPVTSMSESLASTDSSDSKVAEEPSIVDKETVPVDSGSGTRNDVAHGVGSFSYEKAKMFIVERLNDQGEDKSQIVQNSESFERLISLSDNAAFSSSHLPQEENTGISNEATNPLNLHTIEQEDGSASPKPSRFCQETESDDTSNLGTESLVELKTDHGNHPQYDSAISQELISEGNLFMIFVL